MRHFLVCKHPAGGCIALIILIVLSSMLGLPQAVARWFA